MSPTIPKNAKIWMPLTATAILLLAVGARAMSDGQVERADVRVPMQVTPGDSLVAPGGSLLVDVDVSGTGTFDVHGFAADGALTVAGDALLTAPGHVTLSLAAPDTAIVGGEHRVIVTATEVDGPGFAKAIVHVIVRGAPVLAHACNVCGGAPWGSGYGAGWGSGSGWGLGYGYGGGCGCGGYANAWPYYGSPGYAYPGYGYGYGGYGCGAYAWNGCCGGWNGWPYYGYELPVGFVKAPNGTIVPDPANLNATAAPAPYPYAPPPAWNQTQPPTPYAYPTQPTPSAR